MAADKTRSHRRRQKQAASGATGEFISYIKSLAIALLMALVLKHFVIEAYRIPTGSMEDTILVGDFLLANKFIYGVSVPFTNIRIPGFEDPEQGDIVIFKFPLDPSLNYVKRCIAGPGQVVEIRDKQVYVDGKLYQDDEFTKYSDREIADPSSPQALRDNFGPFRVPSGQYFMMGDNRDNSYDSRFWGCVPEENVLGRALFIHWSWETDSNAPTITWSNPITLFHNIGYNFVHFYERVRWERLGQAVN